MARRSHSATTTPTNHKPFWIPTRQGHPKNYLTGVFPREEGNAPILIPIFAHHPAMTDSFKPTTPHTINPLDPKHPLLFVQSEDQTTRITGLTIFTEGPSGEVRSEFMEFVDRLQSLEKFVIHWKALNWVMLGENELRALVRLFSLPSLQELQILASANFPLCLLRYFSGTKLCVAATTLATAVMPVFPSDIEARKTAALMDLSLVGARNIREFRTFIEWRANKVRSSLQSIKCLQCSVSWRDQEAKPEDVLKDIGSLLQGFGSTCHGVEELRILDWQNNSFDGYQFTQADLVPLTSLKRLHAHLGASPKADEKTMDNMDSSLRKWLLPLLSNLPSPYILETVEVTFSFIVPFPWPTDLHTWMQSFSTILDSLLAAKFPRLRTANLTFDLRNAHTRPYNWKAFNSTLQPTKLQAQGVACAFKAEVYRP